MVTWDGGRKETAKVRKVEEEWWRGGERARVGGGACGWSQEWREGGSGRGGAGGRMPGEMRKCDVALAARVGQIPGEQQHFRSSAFPPTTRPP